MSDCPACLNGCGGARSDCPKREGALAVTRERGRPSSYRPEIAEDICAHLASGGLLIRWCEQPGRPHIATIYRWMEAHPDFREAYARARETGLHVMAEEIIAISDDGSQDMTTTEDGREVLDHEHVQRSRLRVDSRKWLASKLLAKVYGDKATVAHTGPNGGPQEVVLRWAGESEG